MAYTPNDFSDFARTQVSVDNALNNTTNPITIAVDDNSVFATISAGQLVTISSAPNPMDDASREKAKITAKGTGTVTLSRPAAQAHTGKPYLIGALFAEDMTNIKTALDAIGTPPKSTLEAVVAGTGGDRETLGASLVAGERSIVLRRGTYAETTNLYNLTAASGKAMVIEGEDRDNTIVQLAADANGYFKIVGNGSVLRNLTISIPDTALISNTTGWIYVDALNVTLDNVRFIGSQTASRTGCVVYVKSTSKGFSMHDCSLYQNGAIRTAGGIVVIDGASDFKVVHNQLDATTNLAAEIIKGLNTCTNGQVVNNTINSGTHCTSVSFATLYKSVVNENIINMTGASDQSVFGIKVTTLNDSVMKENIIHSGLAIGIDFGAASNSIVNHNKVYHDSFYCVQGTGLTNSSLSYNNLYNYSSYNGCIRITSTCSNPVIDGNNLKGGGNGPMIYLASGSGAVNGFIRNNSWGGRTSDVCIYDSNQSSIWVIDNPQPTKVVTSSGTAQTVNMKFYTNFYTILNNNCTLTFDDDLYMTYKLEGQMYRMEFRQDATGSRTLTWPANVRWDGGSQPAAAAANKTEVYELYWSRFFEKYNARRVAVF